MKSLILKDFYNIGHNAKSMLLMLVFLCVLLTPSSGINGFIAICSVMCSMMIITTFSFDEASKWTRYAMIMPLSKNELVRSKYVVLLLFTLIGTTCGSIIGIIAGMILRNLNFKELLLVVVLSLAACMVMGSIAIPLLFCFGAEKARIFSIVSFAIPAFIYYVIFKIIDIFQITIAKGVMTGLLYSAPVLVLLFMYFSYKLSCRIFGKKEL